ncbi:MAG: desulfoferrodoxin [Candidatus Parcubacteria bacterium]|nr:desulfoferrodoxin [Candidatus Parcubacteria bacterium]
MSEKNQIYQCSVCGQIIEILEPGKGQLVCCGLNMNLLKEKNQDEGMEKHVPVLNRNENGWQIQVGTLPHPMEETHYIKWIELISIDGVYRIYLKPGDMPAGDFQINTENIKVRIYCNVHGLWQS